MIVYLADLFGVAVFAVSGALAAGRKRMDLFGVCVLGLVTAVGGGTLRDLLLGLQPVFWIEDPIYVYVALASAVVTFVGARTQPARSRVLLVADAIGLAVFSVIGADRALQVGESSLIAVIMGILTGVAGGMIRDVLTGEIPLILRTEIYATAAAAGAGCFVLLSAITSNVPLNTVVSASLTLVLRLAAIRWGLSLPTFFVPEDEK